jgi:hypothetical protein
MRKKYVWNKVFEVISIEIFNIDIGPATHLKTNQYITDPQL